MFRQRSALSSTILLVVLIFIISVALLTVAAEAEMSGVMGGPPERPEVFRNPEELKEYLKALNDYFAIVGRPRFGRGYNRRSIFYSQPDKSEVGLDM